MLAGVWGKGKLHCWRDCNLVQPLWKTGRRFHKDYKCNYHINRCSTSGNTCEGNKISMRDLHPQVRWSIIYTSQAWKQPKFLWADEWEEKVWYTQYTHSGIFSHKKKETLPFETTSIDFEDGMLSEVSQRNTNTASSHLDVECKNQANKQKNPTEKEFRFVLTCGDGWEM